MKMVKSLGRITRRDLHRREHPESDILQDVESRKAAVRRFSRPAWLGPDRLRRSAVFGCKQIAEWRFARLGDVSEPPEFLRIDSKRRVERNNSDAGKPLSFEIKFTGSTGEVQSSRVEQPSD